MSVYFKCQNLDRLEEPTRMFCRLCETTLATHNCGNAKKHLRYKHIAEFFEVQATDIQSRSGLTTNKVHKKSVYSNRQSPKRLTIDQITALLMPKIEPAELLLPTSSEQCDEKSTDHNSGELGPEIQILRKAIKMYT
jgi:hypothetical protein